MDNAVTVIERCVHELRAWLRSHFLKCNNDKTEALVIGSRRQTIKIHIPQVMIGASEVRPVDSVRDLRVVFDSGMIMEGHISAVCRSDCRGMGE